MDAEHLLLALLDQSGGLIPRLLERAQIDVPALRAGLERQLEGRPSVSGPGAAPGEVYVSRALSQVLDAAEAEAERLKDEYVSVEHVLLAMIERAPAPPPGRLLKEHGVTRERFLQTLTEVRGSQRVTSATPESAYEALEKYGRDLVAEARLGTARPGDRPRRRDPPRDPDPVPQDQEQPGARRRPGRRARPRSWRASRSGSCAATCPRG